MKLYVRSDLKMRKGKMAAQSAHATNKLFLEYTHNNNNVVQISSEKMKHVLDEIKKHNISVEFIKREEDLNSLETPMSSIIIDNGRTEFNGVKTKTVLCSGLFEGKKLHEFNTEGNREQLSKQILIFSKEHNLSKENACKLAGLSSLHMLCSFFKEGNNCFELDLNEKNAITSWVTGAFAKISVSTETDEKLFEVAEKLSKNSINFLQLKIDDNIVLCVEPCYAEQIDPITGSLKLI